ncbi:MAG: hypothetical protein AAF192_12770 [Pseudomonadota bacterium]
MTDRRNRLPLTCEDTVGPYYPLPFLDGDRMDLTRVHPGLAIRPAGEARVLAGRVLDRHGALAHGVLLEFQQADPAGAIRGPGGDGGVDPWFEGVARCRTDGTFRLRTLRPGPVAPERAPHVTLTIFSDGFARLVTQIFFGGEAANAADPVLASLDPQEAARLVAAPTGEAEDGAPVYALDIVLAGEGETPFFDDRPEAGVAPSGAPSGASSGAPAGAAA